ncbi:hypothetical protein C0Z19_02695 [Trinickia soli]|uniref:Uncharacterized protein n=1 Tax=Trinickia soli TaxID=380675 RepID=A0A2N7WE18_9BURK|nr:hypothetical protein C0Z19_02695 [Trinickia soli]
METAGRLSRPQPFECWRGICGRRTGARNAGLRCILIIFQRHRAGIGSRSRRAAPIAGALCQLAPHAAH